MATIKTLSDLENQIISSYGLLLVRFCAEWSGSCQIMESIYEEVSKKYKNEAVFYKVDIDKSPLLKIKYGITQLPTFLFYKNGVYIDFVKGLISRETLIEKIENALKSGISN